jgi:hypothetical protein
MQTKNPTALKRGSNLITMQHVPRPKTVTNAFISKGYVSNILRSLHVECLWLPLVTNKAVHFYGISCYIPGGPACLWRAQPFQKFCTYAVHATCMNCIQTTCPRAKILDVPNQPTPPPGRNLCKYLRPLHSFRMLRMMCHEQICQQQTDRARSTTNPSSSSPSSAWKGPPRQRCRIAAP